MAKVRADRDGYVPLADIGAEFLFQVNSERAERAAIVVTTNLRVDDGVSESAIMQGFARPHHGSSAHH